MFDPRYEAQLRLLSLGSPWMRMSAHSFSHSSEASRSGIASAWVMSLTFRLSNGSCATSDSWRRTSTERP